MTFVSTLRMMAVVALQSGWRNYATVKPELAPMPGLRWRSGYYFTRVAEVPSSRYLPALMSSSRSLSPTAAIESEIGM